MTQPTEYPRGAEKGAPRNEIIDSALKKLRAIEAGNTDQERAYAIRESIIFLEAARSFPRYLWWLFFIAPKLDGPRLLELTDFPVEEWDVAMHERLIALQRRKQPGLVTPLVSAITEYIQKESRDLVVVDLGAGGMEVDRQVAEWAVKTDIEHKLTIISVDKSSTTRGIAEKNLRDLANDVEIFETGELTGNELENLRHRATKKILIVMCTNDIFELDQKFGPKYFDLVYHSLFRHHLNESERQELDDTIHVIGKRHFEFDGYKSWLVMLPQTIVGWNYPNFLNAELFSNLRFKEKRNILARAQAKGDVSFFGVSGFYLLKFRL
jgi:hypothetical protein